MAEGKLLFSFLDQLDYIHSFSIFLTCPCALSCEEMEKNGERNKIHISEETAALLRKGGKSHWLQARPSKVNVRSKGALQTYFVFPKSNDCSSTGSSSDAGSDGKPAMSNVPSNHDLRGAADHNDVLDSKNQRLVDWNVQILARLLKLIVASRQAHAGGEDLSDSVSEDVIVSKKGTTVLDEVKEIVTLPKYTEASTEVNADDVELSPAVLQQLNTFVYDIASWYNANPFHNFEHASHVTMVRSIWVKCSDSIYRQLYSPFRLSFLISVSNQA